MAKIRSPNYPSLTLSEAIAATRPVFSAENRNKMSKAVLAKHLGYSSLNGRALSKIGAVRAYGLIEGSGDELKVSDDAVALLNAPESALERREALARCAFRPPLFKELQEDFPASGPLPSEANVTYELVKSRFTQGAAGKAAKTYLDAMRLVQGGSGGYSGGDSGEKGGTLMEPPTMTPAPTAQPSLARRTADMMKALTGEHAPGTRREIFALDEGDVILTFPENLSSESYEDLEAHLQLFLRKAKRRVEAERRAEEAERRINNDPDD